MRASPQNGITLTHLFIFCDDADLTCYSTMDIARYPLRMAKLYERHSQWTEGS